MSTFAQTFSERLASIEARAKAAGSNVTQICKKTGVARATYERWVQRPPQTIVKVDELEAFVAQLEADAAVRQQQAPASVV